MNQVLSVILFLFVSVFSFSLPIEASRSQPFASEEDAEAYLALHYDLGCEYYQRGEWRRACTEFEKVIHFFPTSETAAIASYYLAICYFEMKEYDFANTEFSSYLKASDHPAFFEEAVYYKFCIAEYFRSGQKKRFFKVRYFPKWASAEDLALTIYDEVVAALPNHPLTIQALYAKADLLKRMREYREAIDTYQMIIRRFPKDEIVPACYLNIADVYLEQSRYEFQNPDILALAELNARKFKHEFPRDERGEMIEERVSQIKELYAKGLCDLGLFYERLNQPAAAAIYYQSSIEEFPDTNVSAFCRSRLICLGYMIEEEEQQPAIIPQQPFPSLDVLVPHCPASQEIKGEGEGAADYLHYSLLKKREVNHVEPPLPEETTFRQADSQVLEVGDPCPYKDGLIQDHQTADFLHYSLLKKRHASHPSEE